MRFWQLSCCWWWASSWPSTNCPHFDIIFAYWFIDLFNQIKVIKITKYGLRPSLLPSHRQPPAKAPKEKARTQKMSTNDRQCDLLDHRSNLFPPNIQETPRQGKKLLKAESRKGWEHFDRYDLPALEGILAFEEKSDAICSLPRRQSQIFHGWKSRMGKFGPGPRV